jgi:fluoroacetyl-CoA thioesterase
MINQQDMPDIKVKAGLKHSKTMIVEYQHTAAAFGSGLIPVFATPAMVGLMENTAQEAVQPFLPEGFITLGTEMNVKHFKASPVGMRIICEVILIGQDNRHLVFHINARDEEGEIGEAVHHRFIVNAARFMEKFSKP